MKLNTFSKVIETEHGQVLVFLDYEEEEHESEPYTVTARCRPYDTGMQVNIDLTIRAKTEKRQMEIFKKPEVLAQSLINQVKKIIDLVSSEENEEAKP